MRILFITNASTERCGVRTYGEEMISALRRAGVSVEVWDGTYSTVVRQGYLPDALAEFDLLHLNWDPQAINHYLPEHFANTGKPLSVFLHDVPPNSTCPVAGVATWRFGFEPAEGVQVIPEAVPVYKPQHTHKTNKLFTVGVTGIRSDPGMEMVETLCQKEHWIFNAPKWWTGGAWLSTEDEIERLAMSDVNVCWYETSGRGKSMAAMFCAAARRPLVLSGSTMFSACWPYSNEIMLCQTHRKTPPYTALKREYTMKHLRDAIGYVDEKGIVPKRICEELSWDTVIELFLAAWRDR